MYNINTSLPTRTNCLASSSSSFASAAPAAPSAAPPAASVAACVSGDAPGRSICFFFWSQNHFRQDRGFS